MLILFSAASSENRECFLFIIFVEKKTIYDVGIAVEF